MKASLFRRVHAWASETPEERVRAYLSIVQSRLDQLHGTQAKGFRWAFLLIVAFELLLASSVSAVSIGPIEVSDLKLVTLLLPAAISYCLSSVFGIAVFYRLLTVSESACIRVLFHTEWMLGIDMPIRHATSLQDHHLEAWGRPAKQPAVQRVHGAVLGIYLLVFSLVLMLYAPVAAVRAGIALGFDSPVFWLATVIAMLGLLRSILAHTFAGGAWELDEDLPAMAHLMSDEDVARWRELVANLKAMPEEGGSPPGSES